MNNSANTLPHSANETNTTGQAPERPYRGWPKPRVRLSAGTGYRDVENTIATEALHTVCKSARCPNVGECWSERTATFMLLGNVCTRACRFCAVQSGRPHALDWEEPNRVAEAIIKLEIDYAVITSVNRDDQENGGAEIFAETVRLIRDRRPQTSIELLIPDFCGKTDALDIVLNAGPDVLNHNVETVPRLYPTIQPWSDWDVSLETIRHAKHRGFITKSGIICGLGESPDELLQAIAAMKSAGVDILTVGQYLQPTQKHAPIHRMVPEDEYAQIRAEGERLGFSAVLAGPLVRSSYRAKWAYHMAMKNRGLTPRV